MLGINHSLTQAQQSAQTSMERLAAGKKTRHTPQDDAVALAVATSMLTQAGGSQQAISNAGYGLNALETADGGLAQVSSNLQNMRELAVQAGNGTLSASDRQALQAVFDQYQQANTDLAGQTEFNGQKLLDGSYGAAFQVGPQAGDQLKVAIGNASPGGLGVAGLNLGSPATASSALDALDAALGQVGKMREQIGADSQALSAQADFQQTSYANSVAAAASRSDTDPAAEISSLQQAQLQSQVASYAMQQYAAMQQQGSLGLLGIA